MAAAESRHASKSSISALEAARARIRKDDHSFEPRTPPHRNRSIVSSFGSSSSPLSSFRNEEDAIIFELGARSLRAGFEGESTPMCSISFGPDESRKVGDYRAFISSSETEEIASSSPLDAEEWVKNHELWRMDLREVDLGLVEDKIERAIRDVYNNYLLTDAGNARLVLVLPSVMPHPLLSAILSTLFNRWRFPSITLLPSAAMVAAAAGVRAALVVDLGWAETTVSGIYEYRDLGTKRSTRAVKSLMQQMGQMLSNLETSSREEIKHTNKITADFEYCEEVVCRYAWCKDAEEDQEVDLNRYLAIPSPSKPNSSYVQVPFSRFAEPVESNFFANSVDEHELDDDEKPIHVLIYNALLELPPDIRGTCMSRIIFVGGGSKIPGIRQRIMNEVTSLVAHYGWDATRGRVVEEQRKRIEQLSINGKIESTSKEEHFQDTETGAQDKQETEKEEEKEELDFVEQKIRRNQARNKKPFIHGQFRQVESLGAWAGASLVTSLKIRGLVEVEREKFLRDGLASANRDMDGHHVPDRRSGVRSSVVSDRSSWTLAGWG